MHRIRFLTVYWPGALSLTAGALGDLWIAPLMLRAWASLEILRPIMQWLFTRGLGDVVPYYAQFYFRVPSLVINALAGVCIGLLCSRRCALLAGLYGTGSLASYLLYLLYGGSPYSLSASSLVKLGVWALAFASIPVWVALLVSRRRRRLRARMTQGLCVYCGYNLTGNVSGVCPECGSAVG